MRECHVLALGVIALFAVLLVTGDAHLVISLAGALLGGVALLRTGPAPVATGAALLGAGLAPRAPGGGALGAVGRPSLWGGGGPTAAPPARFGPAGEAGRGYRGAVELDALDSMPEFGARDQAEADARDAPPGNPFDLARVAAPKAAPPCADDEANSAEFDVDEGAALSGLARNEPTRPTIGTIQRKRDLDPYLREEVEEYEELPWYGRHEL